ncbi:hypothetical protein COCSADRAFT_160300 [Bipolaris sorokiniana ND90Pr]|uniref:Uncharacterized protein n=1 Tax=Cochliobolus sativus (strain ND90Pr / ATCC 201652) TaxID=665912 RepID=M2S9R2_COCSN|nr:uncharacterized protein COCSADRAFT_160300 [Bipolaris sorokiniana ND90Pr]EMD64053.1 hypothetical protein COCSADRAFT_160300 [Bipolaris sorokiniana ND90Pr]
MEHFTTATEHSNTTTEQLTLTMKQPTFSTPPAFPTSTTIDISSSLNHLSLLPQPPLPPPQPRLYTPTTLLSIPLPTVLALLDDITCIEVIDKIAFTNHIDPSSDPNDLISNPNMLPASAYHFFHAKLSRYLVHAAPTLTITLAQLREELDAYLTTMVWLHAVLYCGESVREKIMEAVASECVEVIEEDEGADMAVVKKVVKVWKEWMQKFVGGLVVENESERRDTQDESVRREAQDERVAWGMLVLVLFPSLVSYLKM